MEHNIHLDRFPITATVFAVKAIFNLIYGQDHANTMMRRLILVSAILVLATMALAGSVAAAGSDTVGEKLIHADGSGTVTGTPDRVQISFAVETENPDVKSAQSGNAVQMTQVINALAGAGVPRDSMKTTGYSIYPEYQDSTILNPIIKTYHVTNTVQVTLDNVSLAGDVIDLAVANGANQVNSIQFMLSDAQAQTLRSTALKNAVANARADAGTVADAMGVNISGTRDVVISQGYTPVVYNSYSGETMSAAKAAVPTPVQPGEVTVTADVSIDYTYQ